MGGTEESLPQGGTTWQITNVPVFLTQGAMVALFADLLGSDNIDFFYCPWDPVAGCNLGYAIINFCSRSDATNFENVFRNGKVFAGVSKKMRLMPTALQGRAANMKHFSEFSLSKSPDPRFRPLTRSGPGEPLRPLSLISEAAPAAFAREFGDSPPAEWNLIDPGTYQATQSQLQMLRCWELLRAQGGKEANSSETATSAEPSIHGPGQQSSSALPMSCSGAKSEWELLLPPGGKEANSSEVASSAEPSIHGLRQKSSSALPMSCSGGSVGSS